jgi:tRNA(His) guanylyltransferase
MAKSKYEYTRKFEAPVSLLPEAWIVIRIDGHSFHKFTQTQDFTKPNDLRGLLLMNEAAKGVMQQYEDVLFAYGQSDEYSLVFKRSTSLWGRRESKLVSNIVSLFTGHYCMGWKSFFNQDLKLVPSFDARAVLYPNDNTLRDYVSWRQVDCHINNLYNTCFWALLQDPKRNLTENQVQIILKDTDAAAKNELLFSDYGINYAKIDPIFRKGSFLYREKVEQVHVSTITGKECIRQRSQVKVIHDDLISNDFWEKTKILD